MTITIYTISNDPFCTQEKDYLTSKGLTFEEKNLETNREFLAEMQAVSDKFSGVPFTIIVKDDGSKVMLKGFTKEEFEESLGEAQAEDDGVPTQMPHAPVPAQQTVQPSVPTPTPTATPSTPPTPAPAATPAPEDPQKELDGVLSQLSSKTGADISTTGQDAPKQDSVPQTPTTPPSTSATPAPTVTTGTSQNLPPTPNPTQ